MLSHKKSLNILKKTNALLEGHFILLARDLHISLANLGKLKSLAH